MTRKQRRIRALVIGGIVVAGAAVWLVSSLESHLVFFRSPGELAVLSVPPDEKIRIGGLVVEGSLIHQTNSPGVRFVVTDFEHMLDVLYSGRAPLPDLFREGQGVVAEGYLGEDGVFRADRVLAKHDENYMPPEVADILKKNVTGETYNP